MVLVSAIWLVTTGLAAAQAVLFVSNWGNGTIGEYDVSSGSLIRTIAVPYTASNGEGQGGWSLAIAGNSLYVSVPNNNLVMVYNASTGAVINSALVTGLNTPLGLSVSGNTLYVSNNGSNKIATYNATTGALINASFATVPVAPYGTVISGNTLYVTSSNYGLVGAYNATTGAAINASLVSGLPPDYNVAISGNHLFVSGYPPFASIVGEYDATTGAAIKTSFITGIPGANAAMAVFGNDLFVSSDNAGTISEYDATTGALIENLVSGLNSPHGLAVFEVPEPSTYGLLGLGVVLLGWMGRRARVAACR